MIPKFLKGIAAAALCVLFAASATSAQQLLSGSFSATPPAFSPNGDGSDDVTFIRFTLADTASSLSLVVFQADSVTPVDTLIAAAPDSTLGARVINWDGGGAPEGAYVVTLDGSGIAGQDTTVSIPVFIDLTAPTIQVTGVTPARYAPGVSGQASVLSVTFVASGVSTVFPGRVADELQMTVRNPLGAPLDAADVADNVTYLPPLYSMTPPRLSVDGSYSMQFDASTMTGLRDGNHTFEFVVIDAAGFIDTDTVEAYFDIDSPEITFLNLAAGSNLSSVPDSLRGWSWDQNGIDSLRVKYNSAGTYHPVTPLRVVADTAFFAIPLSDSITTEGSHAVTVRATDGVTRVTASRLPFTFDASSTGPPELEPFSGNWHTVLFTVRGKFPPGAQIEGVARIYRNNVLVDSVFTFLDTEFERRISLELGYNAIHATYVDAARNESGPSNTIEAVFDDGGGLFMPAPFRPNDEFVVNTSEPSRVKVHVYDLRGDFVIALESDQPNQNHAIPWDGRNQNGVSVKKGPFVAVAKTRLADGTTQQHREIFLYEPHR